MHREWKAHHQGTRRQSIHGYSPVKTGVCNFAFSALPFLMKILQRSLAKKSRFFRLTLASASASASASAYTLGGNFYLYAGVDGIAYRDFLVKSKIHYCGVLLFVLLVHAQSVRAQSSVADSICANWQSIMFNSILPWRHDGIPVGSAMSVMDSERDISTRFFLYDVVRSIYADPAGGVQYLRSGAFMQQCLKVKRGY